MQISPVQKFIRNIITYTLFIILISALNFYFLLRQYYLQIFPFLILLFLIINTLFFYILIHYSEKRPAVFARSFLLGWGLKFFIYVIFLLSYLFLHKEQAIPFLIQFILLYFAYAVFEVVYLIRNFKKGAWKGKI